MVHNYNVRANLLQLLQQLSFYSITCFRGYSSKHVVSQRVIIVIGISVTKSNIRGAVFACRTSDSIGQRNEAITDSNYTPDAAIWLT